MSGRQARVLNKAPAPIQITAEQLLTEARERQIEALQVPRQSILDNEELSEYQGRKRGEFEKLVRKSGRAGNSAYVKYANWEASQNEYARARSVFERGLDADPRSVPLWMSYIEFELRTNNPQHARNLLDRAVTLLPRVDALWLRYVHVQELLGDVEGARTVFERWCSWEPDERAWQAFIKLELRHEQVTKARAIYERMIECHPSSKNFIAWAKWEFDQGEAANMRRVFEMAMEYFGESVMDQNLIAAFAKCETKLKEFERARAIYRFALERIPRSKSESLYAQYTMFEKQYGDRDGIENVVIGKRRILYQEEITRNPRNYDAYFDYARLEELAGETSKVREVYEKGIASTPPTKKKSDWRRYIFIWINYALYEELTTNDYVRAREIYKACLGVIPHKSFTFAKVWILAAQFEIRRLNIDVARKILGRGIGMAPKEKLFKSYIELEMSLREFERCRKLYEKHLEWNPSASHVWIKFAEMERMLEETERCRAIFDLAVAQDTLDMPELLWKAYIDFEFDLGEYDRTRKLYTRLLEKSSHPKVWTSFAQFELSAEEAVVQEEDDTGDEIADASAISDESKARARAVFERGYKSMKDAGLGQDRVSLLESWKVFEQTYGSAESLKSVEAKFPNIVKKRQRDADGYMEERQEYVWPDDESRNHAALSFLQRAQAWKEQQKLQEAENDADHLDLSGQ